MQGIDSAVAPTDYIFWYNGHSFIIHSRISIAIIYIGSYNGWRSSPARDQTRFRRTRRDRSRPSLHVPALHARSRRSDLLQSGILYITRLLLSILIPINRPRRCVHRTGNVIPIFTSLSTRKFISPRMCMCVISV